MVQKVRSLRRLSMIIACASLSFSQAGCVLVPRTQLDESQKVAQILRAENARLKDQVLVAKSENRDASDRAIDDAQRLATQEKAIARLEESVRAYQDDRDQLATAFEEFKANLDPTSGGRRPISKAARPSNPRRQAAPLSDDEADPEPADTSDDAQPRPRNAN